MGQKVFSDWVAKGSMVDSTTAA